MKTKRQELGEVIAFMREESHMTRHNLADKIRSSTPNVERMERGDLCPTTQEWQRMRAVFPKLTASRYRDLHNGAALEQSSEQAGASEPTVRAAADLDAAVHLVLEAVPGLHSLTLEVLDDGEVWVQYKTREVRVVEDAGSLRITKKVAT